jgi:succinyl-CoA synthetase alpha subunit
MLSRLIDRNADPIRVLVQGATGRTARNHIRLMRGHGTAILAGVSPRHDGETVDGVPLFRNCVSAIAASRAEASIVMVPPLDVLPAITEAAEAGIGLIVTVTEGMPLLDAARARHVADANGARWVGASTPGLAVPGRIKLGFLPEATLMPGPLAVWSKSGTLSYETCLRLKQRGIGQSAWIGVGGDPVKGTRFADLVETFRDHGGTGAVLIVGEIGGSEEEDLAEMLRAVPIGKPVFAILAGSSAPEGVTMGHAGAMIERGRGTLASKKRALEGAGVKVFTAIRPVVDAVAAELEGRQA